MANPSDRSMAARQIRNSALGMTVKAEIGQLLMLRTVAEAAAMVAGFVMEEVTDLRVALDEIATCLMVHAVPCTEIRCEFTADTAGMRVRVEGLSTVPNPIDDAGIGWQVLVASTDGLEIDCAEFDPEAGGYPVTAAFARARLLVKPPRAAPNS
ncbi:anti-sigma factor [Nocardia mangyaensis]|uniref:anti-sigma factor n=1 Tax=Nocardia mangyaensis TaxID=2213200 RepID=UPI00267659CD|nr:anti-sigma factor [Nocardia mangyaensis]MDO3647719.1 anti-sigma factor [Nocardia mangyaensis]